MSRAESSRPSHERGCRSGTDRKTIRFDEATVAHIESLVDDGEYVSFSAAVRQNLPADWPDGRADE